MIAAFKRTLKSTKTSPITKLTQIRDHIDSIKAEINFFYQKSNLKMLPERGDLLSILIYILCKTCVEDLQAQLTIISNFISDDIKYGSSRLSASYTDFKCAVEFLVSLDRRKLEEDGPDYIQNVKID